MAKTNRESISSKEDVVRLISSEWIVKGTLQPVAFTLNYGESYLSVNRPIIETYDDDVAAFLFRHPTYRAENEDSYYCAMLNVGKVEESDISFAGGKMIIDVEVEPRNAHTKSHAGIFTRYQGKNIKRGQHVNIAPATQEVSTDDILLEVRNNLLDMAILRKKTTPCNEKH